MAEFPPSEHLKDLLETHVGTSGWSVEIGIAPDSPDKVIQIVDTGGWDDPNPKYLRDFPTCQIMVRGETNKYLDAFRESKAVKDILLGVPSQTINLDRLVSVLMRGDSAFIGLDELDRPLFTSNFALIIEPQLVGNSNRLAV